MQVQITKKITKKKGEGGNPKNNPRSNPRSNPSRHTPRYRGPCPKSCVSPLLSLDIPLALGAASEAEAVSTVDISFEV